MYSRNVSLVFCVGSIVLISMGAQADDEEHGHYDIAAWNDNGILRTGGWDHDEEILAVNNLRVFEAHFGEDPEFPFAIDGPGIGGVAADLGLPVNSVLSMNMNAGLDIWNGNGFDASGSSMFVEYGPSSMSSATGGHLDFLISDDYDLHPIYMIDPAADTGAYLLEFSFSMDGFIASDPFWIVFNLGMDDEEFEESVEWVEANLVPAPGGLALIAVSLVAQRRRRR